MIDNVFDAKYNTSGTLRDRTNVFSRSLRPSVRITKPLKLRGRCE